LYALSIAVSGYNFAADANGMIWIKW